MTDSQAPNVQLPPSIPPLQQSLIRAAAQKLVSIVVGVLVLHHWIPSDKTSEAEAFAAGLVLLAVSMAWTWFQETAAYKRMKALLQAQPPSGP